MDISTSWFLAFPDSDAATAVADAVAPRARQTVRHPSGRVWLSGAWGTDEVVTVAGPGATVAVAGPCSRDRAELTRRLAAVRTIAEVESVVAGAVGSFLLFASVGGTGYARGPVAGTRRLFTARHRGVALVADRARTLAWLTGAVVEPERVAARLASPGVPSPVDGAPVWAGVDAVRPGDAVRTAGTEPAVIAPWWRPPEMSRPLAESAPALREALTRVVALYTRAKEPIGADLSGGFDSTSLCFLAADAGAKLLTLTVEWSAAGSQDHRYAAIARDALPLAGSLTFAAAELPAQFAGIDERADPPDEPWTYLRSRTYERRLADEFTSAGATCRISGHGGDDVAQAPHGFANMLRRAPVAGLRRLAAFRAWHRWSARDTASAVLDRRSYADWVRASGAGLTRGAPGGAVPGRWGAAAALPSWSTESAVTMVAGLLWAADPVVAHADDPVQHAWLHSIRQSGRLAEELFRTSTAAGLPCHSPFLDQAVVEACVATLPEQARDPRAYKPLLGAAMSGVLPDEVRRRTSKDHNLPEFHAGLRAQQRVLAQWCETSRLAELGLVDAAALRRVALNPELLGRGLSALDKTIAVEAWLRDLEAYPVPAYLGEER